MFSNGPHDFDIDVDLTELLGGADSEVETLLDDRWYHTVRPRPGRSSQAQAKMETLFSNAMLHAQWEATRRRKLDRRRAIRAPILSRVHVTDGLHLTATNISLSGLCASGHPLAPLMTVEFKIPGMDFPVDTRVEVVNYKNSSVIPLVGLRFVDLERPYVDAIAGYIGRRRENPPVAKAA